MKKLLFVFALLLTPNAFAATGSGEAQATLEMPLRLINSGNVEFGTVSIDPSAGPQTLSMEEPCPSEYVCTGSKRYGTMIIAGAKNTVVNASVVGETAVMALADGESHTITFDPFFRVGAVNEWGETLIATTDANGYFSITISGTINLTGNELGGIYSSTNAGGSGYQITVNY